MANKYDEQRRYGRFYLPYAYIENETKLARTAQIFSALQFVPLRAEMLAATMSIEYAGWSPLFEVSSCAAAMPEYRIEVGWDNDGQLYAAIPVRV